MQENSPVTKVVLTFFVLVQALVPSTASAGEILGRIKRLFGETHYKGTEPCMGEDGSMECLAENIDWLEHHIDTYGSVVAKQPDIWGEARLTKHRDEYERVMFGELGKFEFTINAAITQSDGAFLAQALALSAAASGTTVPTTSIPQDPPASVAVGSVAATLKGAPTFAPSYAKFGIGTTPNQPKIDIEPVVHLDQMSRYLAHLHELRRINEGDDTSDSPGYSMNLVRIPVSILPGKLTREGFGAEVTVTAEPVISDDLMPTTFRNLAVNDVVDLLGLPVVRVTESLTKIRTAVDDSEKKPREFTDAIARLTNLLETHDDVNAFAKRARPIILYILEEPDFISSLLEKFEDISFELETSKSQTPTAGLLTPNNTIDTKFRNDVMSVLNIEDIKSFKMTASEMAYARSIAESTSDQDDDNGQNDDNIKKTIDEVLVDLITAINMPVSPNEKVDEVAKNIFRFQEFSSDALELIVEAAAQGVDDAVAENEKEAKDLFVTTTPSGRARRALNPLNPSSLEPVMGIRNFLQIAEFFEKTYYGKYIRWNGGRNDVEQEGCVEHRVDLLDARKFLEAELQAAYEMLCEPDHVQLFARLASPGSRLATQIRNGHFICTKFQDPAVEQYRHYFFHELHQHTSHPDAVIAIEPAADSCYGGADEWLLSQIGVPMGGEAATSVEALAWAIVVESALLNERLNQDVRKLAKAKEVYELNTDRDYLFFLPDTVMAPGTGLEPLQTEFSLANEVFKRYVSARWPIHVFAVDPTNQDQNVADVSQRKRELQFALALGFATGQIGVNSLTQYSRQLDMQVETISLNRTVVGFGHGADTFGWRFYPRVQALDVPGTFGSIRETLMGASRDYDLKHRQIESGQRECVAVVLMPSFVPYADFDVRTDWFKLTNPKNTALTMKDSLELSRAVTAMRNSRATCAQCQHLYREGELGRLFKRVDQLERELPLQTYRSLVPYENTLGGFEMFNTGVTDLSPELIGWYGAPGVRTHGDDCGCYRGCTPDPKATCTDPVECKALTDQLNAYNATVAASPVPVCEGAGTTLFLVGDNFSVHDTKVIAGGTCIPHVRLISRELMQVTIPSCVNTVSLCENGKNQPYVAVYVATPYGVTNHLHVPVMVNPDSCGCSPSGVVQNMQPTLAPTLTTVSIQDHHTSAQQMDAGRLAVQSSVNHNATTPVRLASMLQDSSDQEQILALTTQLNEIEAKLNMISVPSSTLSAIDVNVRYPEPVRAESKPTLFDCKEFPLVHRFQVSCGERWRNCRDQLPCN